VLIGVVKEGERIYVAHINPDGSVIGGGRLIQLHSDGTFELCTGTDMHEYGMPVDVGRRVLIRGFNSNLPDEE
jgi:hypothetical protein